MRAVVFIAGLLVAGCSEPVATPPARVIAASTPTPAPHPSAKSPAPSPRFELAAYRDGELELHDLANEVFIRADGELVHADAHDQLVLLPTDPRHEIEHRTGFDGWTISAFGGRGPNDLWAVTFDLKARSTAPERVYRRDGDRWVLLANRTGVLRRSYARFIPWRDRVLGLRNYVADAALADVDESGWRIPAHLQRAVDRELAAVRRGFDILGPTPTPAPMLLPDHAVIHAVAAPTGELFVLFGTGKLVSELHRWGLTGAAATTGVRDELPAEDVWSALAVRAADDAYLGGTAHLLHFDGAAWSSEPAPEDRSIYDLSVTPDGQLWALAGEPPLTLWRRPAPGAAWQPVPIPSVHFPDPPVPDWTCDLDEGCVRSDGDLQWIARPDDAPPEQPGQWWPVYASEIVAHRADDVWLLGTTDLLRGRHDPTHRHVILRTRPAATPLRIPGVGEFRHDDVPGDDWHPRVGCHDNPVFIALHTLPGDAPLTGPDPRVESFVRANPTLLPTIAAIHDEQRGARRIIGILADLPDLATGQALLAAAARIAPEQPRSLECHLSRRVVRRFDPRTGAALEWTR